MNEEAVNPAPHLSWWRVMAYNWESRWWAIQHWARTHLVGLRFCPSCSGYFQEFSMTLPDKCAACYARDYGLPFAYDPTNDRGK